jgi:predicted nuclease of predicted toxin-antitoxin system
VIFLVDEQLPPRLAQWLRERRHDARHVLEIGLGGRPDKQVMTAAADMAAVLVTKDSDFSLAQGAIVPVLWLRFGNIGTQAMLLRLGDVWEEAVTALEQGERIVELR